MNELKLFLLGFLFIYIVQTFDILFQLLTSFISIYISKCNVIINELGASNGEYDDNYRIGFQIPDNMDEKFDDYEDSAKIKKKSRGK